MIHDSGKVSWSDERIEWQRPDGTIVEVDLKKVVVIGDTKCPKRKCIL
jgi:hypothetical protein